MWFAIVFMFRAFGDCSEALHFWYAENEGDLPDNEFVFEAGNGYGPGGSIRDSLPRSLSVGDYFSIVPVNEPFDLKAENYPTIMDFFFCEADTVVTVEPVGFSTENLDDYFRAGN